MYNVKRAKEYYQRNKEKLKEYQKKYWSEHGHTAVVANARQTAAKVLHSMRVGKSPWSLSRHIKSCISEKTKDIINRKKEEQSKRVKESRKIALRKRHERYMISERHRTFIAAYINKMRKGEMGWKIFKGWDAILRQRTLELMRKRKDLLQRRSLAAKYIMKMRSGKKSWALYGVMSIVRGAARKIIERNIARHKKAVAEANVAAARARRKTHPDTRKRDPLWRRCRESKRRGRKRGNGHKDMPSVIARHLKKAKHTCYWCGKKLGKKWHADHITPLCLGGEHVAYNIVKSCVSCNQEKCGTHPNKWSGNKQPVLF